MISGPQIRAARGFLDWTQRELATIAVVPVFSIKRIEHEENGKSTLGAQLAAVQATLEAEGIEFTGDGGVPGVRLHPKKRRT